jgi:hypothetical protein
MAQFVALETVTWRGPLGIRFLDLARGVPVSDGLEVRTWQLDGARVPSGAGPGQIAQQSPLSGIYGFRALPGLRLFETGERPSSDWCASPPLTSPPTADELLDLGTLRTLAQTDAGGPGANFVVTVADRFGRFLPQLLLLCLPKDRLIEVPLFSSPARPAPSGLGAVRGEVWDAGAGSPAGWALVTASADGVVTYATVADARGMFVLFLPYASALPALQGSPPHGSGAIDQLTWLLTIQVYYEPGNQRSLDGIPPSGAPAGLPPDTRSLLQQGAAAVFDQPGVSGPSVARLIRFGDDLVVSTIGGPRLLVNPAPRGSPP